jgi:glycosyltransferase involved in cell wall biosynthesis
VPNPYYSIIMPTHGRPKLLERAIKSVKACKFSEIELIVVADEIDKETFAVAADLLEEEDTFIKRSGSPGPALSRNFGIDHAKGARILFLDDDDALQPEFLLAAKTYCDKHPDEVLFTNYRVIEENREDLSSLGTVTDIKVDGQSIEEVYVKNFIHNHTCLYPAYALKNKRQDEHLASLDDWDFLLNVMSQTKFRHIALDGPVIYKDYVNVGNRRGSADKAKGAMVMIDYLYIYRRWPAPTEQLKLKRKDLLKSVGLDVPLAWL